MPLHRCRLLLATLFVAGIAPAVEAFVTLGSVWASGPIAIHLQLSGGAGLSDGSTSFNAVATAALATWNEHLDRARFIAVSGSPGRGSDGDLINQVFFDNQYYGQSFDENLLAVTTRWTLNDTQRVEADVIFNNAIPWDSYRGGSRAQVWDLRRVALHEFGHALGLDHPDRHGQQIAAMMNSVIGDREVLSADDIAGIAALYGAGADGNVAFPPRNEPADFFNQLSALYRDELRVSASSTYVDPEGAVIWLTEYARQRVGQCVHEVAAQNTVDQINGRGITRVCGDTPPGAIPFPPRDQGLLFMNLLDNTYRYVLERPPIASAVDNEGAVVWVLEYLRYRLNGCHHSDATTKVFQQIRGQGVPPVCAA